MGTTSNIAILQKDGSVRCVKCMYDGYISIVGVVLDKHYNTEENIHGLIDKGSLQELRITHRNRLIITSYYELNEDIKRIIYNYETLDIFKSIYNQEEYNYIFINGTWYVYTPDGRYIKEPLVDIIHGKGTLRLRKIERLRNGK